MNVGDIVRVKDPDHYIVSFGSKVRDRDAIVLRVGPIPPYDMFKGQVQVEFQLRNGRGKKFVEWLYASDLELRP